MPYYKKKNINPFIMLDYPGYFFIINGAFLKEVSIDSASLDIPGLRFPFNKLIIRNDTVFPCISLDSIINIKDRDFYPFYLFLSTADHNLCINSSRLPVIFYEYDALHKIGDYECFSIYKNNIEYKNKPFFELKPNELYNAEEEMVEKLEKLLNGGTGI